MIQRIQTIFLLLIVVLSAITFFSPVAGLYNAIDNIQYQLDYRGIMKITTDTAKIAENTWALSAIGIIIPVMALITIFLYKNRILQLRLTIFNAVLMAGYYGLLFMYLWFAQVKLSAKWFLEIVAAFPLICIILAFLAMRAIAKDEALVKSLNRIR